MARLKVASQTHLASILFLFLTIHILLPVQPVTAQLKSRKKLTKVTQPDIVLTEKETSRYRIVVPAAATPHELKASKVLQDYLLQISGVALPIIPADKGRSRYEIVLGQNERLDELGIRVDFNRLKEDGFLIKT